MMLQPVRGTHDFLPDKMRHYTHLLDLARSVLSRYGYAQMSTPIIEFASIFDHVGEVSDIVTKETYTFPDRGGDRLTLRPEGTAAVMRAVVSNGLTQSLPLRYHYSGPMFRYDRPQKGRYRQFHQLGVELIGVAGMEADVEVITAADRYLRALSLHDKCALHINTLGDVPSREAFTQALVGYFSRYSDRLSEDSKIRLIKNPLRILDSKAPQDRALFDDAPAYGDYLSDAAKKHFDGVQNMLTKLSIPYTVNPLIVRGLDYYVHTTFEYVIQEGGGQGTILGGGRYDGLCQTMGGPHIPGVGWAAGLERLMLLHNYTPDSPCGLGLGILGEEFLEQGVVLAQSLRDRGMRIELVSGGNPGKLLKKIDKLSVSHAMIVGSDEFVSGIAELKHMRSGYRVRLAMDDLSQNRLEETVL